MDFIAVDFETASSSNDSACSVGLAFVENLSVVRSEHYLIRPPSLVFGKKNIEIHGILPEHVQHEPAFPEIWERIKMHFDGSNLIVAHNARFDMSVLHRCLTFYGLDLPVFRYSCSIPITTKVCTGSIPRTLAARADFFGVDMGVHHNAESDAITCARIVAETVRRSRSKTFQSFCRVRAIEQKEFSDLSPAKSLGKPMFESFDMDSAITSDKVSQNTILSGKTVVVTGTFLIPRAEMLQKLLDVGAIIKPGITTKTDFLFVGEQDKRIVGDDGLSSKQEKALRFNAAGSNIVFLTESEFMSIIDG